MSQNLPKTRECTLCIVGTGLAGLNALYVASKYLSKQDKVIIIDQKKGIGGMWRNCYNHVRLHQPYRLFTAGNIPWKLRKMPSYLASRTEVMDHFEECLAQLHTKFTIEELYNYRYLDSEEIEGDRAYHARIQIESSTGERLLIKANYFIKATGFNVQPKASMQFSTTKVQSITPESNAFLGEQMSENDKPVYIVGGGKTGTDAATQLIQKYPGRKVVMLTGRGTAFLNRAKLFPKGAKRLFGGTLFLEMIRQLSMAYDGTNQEVVFEQFLQKFGLKFSKANAQYCLYGLLSPEEMNFLDSNLTQVLNEYLEDIVEENGQVKLLFRSGDRQEIEEDSWIVNCSGHLLRKEHDYEPMISKYQTSISIQQTSALFFVTSFGAYFLTHLLFRKELGKLDLYELHHEKMTIKDKQAYFLIASTQVLYNIIQLIEELPLKIILDCGINFDKWYPAYRLLGFVIKLKRNKKRYLRHLKNTLDTINTEYQVHCRSVKQVI